MNQLFTNLRRGEGYSHWLECGDCGWLGGNDETHECPNRYEAMKSPAGHKGMAMVMVPEGCLLVDNGELISTV